MASKLTDEFSWNELSVSLLMSLEVIPHLKLQIHHHVYWLLTFLPRFHVSVDKVKSFAMLCHFPCGHRLVIPPSELHFVHLLPLCNFTGNWSRRVCTRSPCHSASSNKQLFQLSISIRSLNWRCWSSGLEDGSRISSRNIGLYLKVHTTLLTEDKEVHVHRNEKHKSHTRA